MNRSSVLLLLAVASNSIHAQHPPESTPEPRRKVEGDPDVLFRQIASKNSVEAKDALARLGLSWVAGRQPEDVRLAAINVDDDEYLERVLIVRDGLDSAATVLKRDGQAWWNLGSFYCCSGTRALDPFIGLKDTVWYGTKDIVVHQVGSHGTGAGEVRLFIYRVLKAQLYKVLDIIESCSPAPHKAAYTSPSQDRAIAPADCPQRGRTSNRS